MNKDSDYLWDKSGEPDPEIQQLEEILGTLRYQPRPLEIPADARTDSKPRFFAGFTPRLAPGLAIAATIAIILLGLGLWLSFQRSQKAPESVARKESTPSPVPSPGSTPQSVPSKDQNQLVKVPNPDQKHSEDVQRHRFNNSLLAGTTNRSRNGNRTGVGKDSHLTKDEFQEGKAAKDQLMLALRVASAKLNFAQKKTQNTSPRDVHNQHKIG